MFLEDVLPYRKYQEDYQKCKFIPQEWKILPGSRVDNTCKLAAICSVFSQPIVIPWPWPYLMFPHVFHTNIWSTVWNRSYVLCLSSVVMDSIHFNTVLDWVALECELRQFWVGPYHRSATIPYHAIPCHSMPFHAMPCHDKAQHSGLSARGGPVADWVAGAHSITRGPAAWGQVKDVPRLGITMRSRLCPAGGPYCVLDHQFSRWGSCLMRGWRL